MAIAMLLAMSASVTGCREKIPSEPEPDVEPSVEITIDNVTGDEISFTLSATDADRVAYYTMETTLSELDEKDYPSAKTVFEKGVVSDVTDTPQSFTVSELKEGTSYTIFTAAERKNILYDGDARMVTTLVVPKTLGLITDVKPEGVNVTYNINLPENAICYHTYIEKWYYDYELMVAMQTAGTEFDKNAFVYNLLADYGIACEASGAFTWYAGAEHPSRKVVSLTPGKEYYALAAGFVDGGWSGDACIVPFQMPASTGTSSEDIKLSIDEVTLSSVTIRMECDESKVAFFFYDIYEKSQFDSFKAEKGERGMMDYLFEYSGGNVSGNTYTDKWEVESGKSYVLAVYGVDYNGGEIYRELQADIPVPQPSLEIDLMPYERELQGYHDYNSIFMAFAPYNFANELNVDRVWCSTTPMEKATFDEYMGMLELSGMSLDELGTAFSNMETFGMFNQYMPMFNVYPIYDDAELNSLKKNGYFERVFTDLNPDTEYIFIGVAFDGENPIVRFASAKTAARRDSSEASEGYKAFLGNWTVLGQSTVDWSTYEEYHLRIEQLTPNQSFKVYGWSGSQLGEDYPFEMRYNPESNRIYIEGPQTLGKISVGGKDYDVVFAGKMYVSGYSSLVMLAGYNGPLYTGYLNGDSMALFGQIVNVNGKDQEFMSMNYMLYDGSDYYLHEDDQYDLVNFRTSRAAASAAAPASAKTSSQRVSRKIGTLAY